MSPLPKVKPRKDMGDLRKVHMTPAVWVGSSGVHAVTRINDEGARTAICGLIGRFLVDERLSGGQPRFGDVGVTLRCADCHTTWLENAEKVQK